MAAAAVCLAAGGGDCGAPARQPGGKLYALVSNGGNDTVSVIDLAELRAVAHIGVGRDPTGLAVRPGPQSRGFGTGHSPEVWVVATAGNRVDVIDVAARRVVARIPVEARPFSIDFTPDGRRAFVGNSGSGTVSVIDCLHYQVEATVRVGLGPGMARVTPDGGLVIVPNRGDDTLTLLAADSLAVVATLPVADSPEAVAVLPDSLTAFVTASGTNQVSAVDLRRRALLANIAVGETPVALTVKPDGGELFVANFGAHTVTAINTWRNEVTDTLPAGRNPAGLMAAPDNATLYVSNFGSNQVFEVDVETRRVRRAIPVGHQPEAMALTPEGTLLVLSTGSGQLGVIPPGAEALAALIPVGRAPRDMVVVRVPHSPQAAPRGRAGTVGGRRHRPASPMLESKRKKAVPAARSTPGRRREDSGP